jgi:ferric-dicitrate binding protein FerR (iron transport regulator)
MDRNTEASISENETGREAVLKEGILYVRRRHIAAEGRAVVATAHAKVTVVDGQAAVAVDGARTMVEVAEGRVEVQRATDGRIIVVPAGHYLIIGAAAEPRPEKGRFKWRLEPAHS